MVTVSTPNGFRLDNSGQRIVVDPVTRIEGHMRIEVNVDKDNVIRNAVSTGTMWRGLEVILKGRDPRDAWAFTERICGVCTGSPRAGLGTRGRRRAGHPDPEERQHHPQHHAAHAVCARPSRPLLPSARARLGRCRLRPEGRPQGDLRTGAEHQLDGPSPRRATSATCRPACRSSWRAASSAPSRTPTGATRPISCRRKPI